MEDEKKQNDVIVHPFPPVYDCKSKVLVLGSFPSVKSREDNFYYAHPRNRFWQILNIIYQMTATTVEEKKALLSFVHIALYDSIYSCSITGSADSAISCITPASITPILQETKIDTILCNGTKSFSVYMEYCYPETNVKAIKMPSTSPANAAFSLSSLIAAWKPFLPSAGA